MDDSLPGSSVHEIFQARTLEWVAISFYAYWRKHHLIRLDITEEVWVLI